MTVTPGFYSAIGYSKACGQAVKFLINVVYLDLCADAVAYHLIKSLTDIAPYDEDHFIKTCADCIKYRIIHDYLAVGSERFKLFDTIITRVALIIYLPSKNYMKT